MLVYRARRTPRRVRAVPDRSGWSAHGAPPRLRSPAREWTTRNELTVMDAELHTLLTELGKRSAGGAARSRHYLRPGPARQRYILACARAHAWAAPPHRTLARTTRIAPTLVAARPRALLTTHPHIATCCAAAGDSLAGRCTAPCGRGPEATTATVTAATIAVAAMRAVAKCRHRRSALPAPPPSPPRRATASERRRGLVRRGLPAAAWWRVAERVVADALRRAAAARSVLWAVTPGGGLEQDCGESRRRARAQCETGHER